MYDNNILFLVNKSGQISVIENDEAIKNIGKIKIESLEDVKRLGDTIYLLVTTRSEDALSTNLIIFNINKYEQKYTIKIESNKQHLNSIFKILSVSKNNLLISKNPKITPALNPVSSLIQVDLKTKEVKHKYADVKAKSVVNINVACTENALAPITTYALDNGVTDNLIVKLNRKEILLNPDKNELYYQITTEYTDRIFYILSVYNDIVGRNGYMELSLKQLKNDAICSGK
jgi:hypothetical protein